MSQMAIQRNEFLSGVLSREQALYVHVFHTEVRIHAATQQLCTRLATSSPDAMRELKKIFWQGTDHWDTLLVERAGISGRLVLSDFTRNAIAKFKAKA